MLDQSIPLDPSVLGFLIVFVSSALLVLGMAYWITAGFTLFGGGLSNFGRQVKRVMIVLSVLLVALIADYYYIIYDLFGL